MSDMGGKVETAEEPKPSEGPIPAESEGNTDSHQKEATETGDKYKENGLSWVHQWDPLLPDDLCQQDRYKAWMALQLKGLARKIDKLEWDDWGDSCDSAEWGLEKDEPSDNGKCEGKKLSKTGLAPSELFCEPNKHCFPTCFHYCMNCTIEYPEEVYGKIPTHGPHRPQFPTFGEYSFIPPQRWLHSIEHGAVVMLYHPCAPEELVDQLRKIVVGCLRKHIIAPSTRFTSKKRPLTLVAWLCRLTMATVNQKEVENFIRLRAHLALEGDYPAEGNFAKHLIKKAHDPPHPQVVQVTCKGSGLPTSIGGVKGEAEKKYEVEEATIQINRSASWRKPVDLD